MANPAYPAHPARIQLRALTLIAELHGRMGHFPAIVRLRPVPGVTPLRFEVAEIINLQAVRDQARKIRLERISPACSSDELGNGYSDMI